MDSSYDKIKMLEALKVWEKEIEELETETQPTLQEKQKKDGKRKELQEVERELNEEKGLVKAAADINWLLSFAGEDAQLGKPQRERVTKLEKRWDRLKQAIEAFGDREQDYAEARAADQCLRLYRRLCKQLGTADSAAVNVQEELNLRAGKYLPRQDALGIGLRLLGLSEGVGAAKGLEGDDGKFVNLPEYIRMTAEMLADYIKNHRLEPQEETRLDNILATLYIWLVLSADIGTAQTSFDRLGSLHISWDQEECPAACFEQFYELERQNKATLAVFRLLGYQRLVDSHSLIGIMQVNYTEIAVVGIYLSGIADGHERVEQIWLDRAKEFLRSYIQPAAIHTHDDVKRICGRLDETTSRLGEFRGKPYFREMEEIISAAVNAYYDDEYVREESQRAYREYLEDWMLESVQKTKYESVFKNVRKDMAKQFPLDDLEEKTEEYKKQWVILAPDTFRRQMARTADEKKQIEILERIAKKEANGKWAEITLNEIRESTGYKRTLSLKWMLLAVLVPLNVISMVLFEFVLGFRSFMAFGEREKEEKKQWVKRVEKENRRLNLIAAASMALFYFTGGYGVMEYFDMISWLFSVMTGSNGLLLILLIFGVIFVLVPYFAWTALRGLFELLGDIVGNIGKGVQKGERT